MTEIIEKIEEVEDIPDQFKEYSWCKGDGYKITTNKQEIYILIDNDQSCCESWGYFLQKII